MRILDYLVNDILTSEVENCSEIEGNVVCNQCNLIIGMKIGINDYLLSYKNLYFYRHQRQVHNPHFKLRSKKELEKMLHELNVIKSLLSNYL